MNKPIVFLFSGQGSQYYHMAKRLYENHSVFRETLIRLDRKATEWIGDSVLSKLYDPQKRISDSFDRTLYTHPAIFMVEVALAEALRDQGLKPDIVVGTSLGEYAAAAVAGVMEPEELLECVVRQAQFMEDTCAPGKMIAILTHPDFYHNTPELHTQSELAAVNFDSHFVVSCASSAVQKIESLLRERHITFQTLPVSLAFHSEWIEPAASPFLKLLRGKTFHKPNIPLVSGLHGSYTDDLSGNYLWDAVRQPIRFPEAVQTLQRVIGEGVGVEVGPGGTLTNFLKNLSENPLDLSCSPIITPFHQENQKLEQIQQLLVGRKEQRMIAYLFPGQGSQKKGMGAELFDEFPEWTAKADEILGYSIKQLCLEDPGEELGLTQFTQPALYVVNALSYLKKIKETGQKPDFVAGHSLGEYNALFAAGVFDFETGLRLVQKRGQLMSQAKGGGMAAVIGFTEEQIERVLRENGLSNIEVANYNSPSQIVIAGLQEDILRAKPIFEAAEVRMYIPLKVSGAFHSKYMENSKQEFKQFLNEFEFHTISIPIISNVHARPYRQQDIKTNLGEQMTHSVKWTETIRYLMGKGVTEFEEIGPGNVLKGLVRTIHREAEPLVVEEEADVTVAEEQPILSEAASEIATFVEEPLVQTEPELKPQPEPKPKPQPEPQTQSVPERVDQVKRVDQAERVEQEQPKRGEVTAKSLGNADFKADYGLRYAYVAGSMHQGISSPDLVVRMSRSGMLAFLGTSGLLPSQIRHSLQQIKRELTRGETYGVNVSYNLSSPEAEDLLVDLLLEQGVTLVEASGYLNMTTALVRYRAQGLAKDSRGQVSIKNRILAKVTRPEVAEMFLSPAPERILKKLLDENKITGEQAELLRKIPMADDLCAEADGGGYTDQASPYALLPAIQRMRDDLTAKFGYGKRIRVGSGGGIGTPEAAAAAFVMGADFILTGSINQCTVEANTSDAAKDLLAAIHVQDTEYAPQEAMFEIGGKVQVLKKGLFFPARANKLYDLYRQHDAWQDIPEKTKDQLQNKYFKRTFEEAYAAAKAIFTQDEIDKAERNPKSKMALVFRWYLKQSLEWAHTGHSDAKFDYQIYCGPALGAFNQWVQGTDIAPWRNRHVDQIGERLLTETARTLTERLKVYLG